MQAEFECSVAAFCCLESLVTFYADECFLSFFQEMEKMKEDNETLVHSLRSQIAELNAEILEKDNKIDVNILVSV